MANGDCLVSMHGAPLLLGMWQLLERLNDAPIDMDSSFYVTQSRWAVVETVGG